MKKILVYIFLVLICLFTYYATLHKQNWELWFPYFDAYIFIEDSIKLIEHNTPSRFQDASYIYIFSAFKLLLNLNYETVHIILSAFQLFFLWLCLFFVKNSINKNAPTYSFLLAFIFFYFSGIIAWRLTPGFRENFFIIYIPVMIFLTHRTKNTYIFFLINLFYLSSLFSHQLVFYILTPVYLKYIYDYKPFEIRFIWIYVIFWIAFSPFLSGLFFSFLSQMTNWSEMLIFRSWDSLYISIFFYRKILTTTK